jgi:hypothetical protein
VRGNAAAAQLCTAAAAQPGAAEVLGPPAPRMRPAGLGQEPAQQLPQAHNG